MCYSFLPEMGGVRRMVDDVKCLFGAAQPIMEEETDTD